MQIKIIDFGAPRLPRRAHYNDAGADVFCPYDCVVPPGGTLTVPLGFGLELPDGLCAFVFVRSSDAVLGLDCKLPPIDSGYRGEVHAIIHNTTEQPCQIPAGARVGQLVVLPVILADFVLDTGKERGKDAFGSTGK